MKRIAAVIAVAACAGCTSEPGSANKAMDILGAAAAIAVDVMTPPPPPAPVIVQQPVVVPQTVVVQQPVVQAPVVVQQPVVQAPVAVQQPVVQAPAAPAVQAPAAPAVQAPAVPAAPVAATTATDAAEPEFKYDRLTFKKPATPDQIAAAKAKIPAGKSVRTLDFDSVDDATLAAAIAAFPGAARVTVRKTAVTTLAPFAALKDATEVAIKDADLRAVSLSPLAALPKLQTFTGTYSKFADLSPLAACPELKDVDLYGAEVTSFAPLAACPKLEQVYFYAAKTTPEGYASLGALKQVKRFHGGLTKMTDISWLRQVPQAEEVKIFAENIPDLTPLKALPNLTYVRLWNMKGDRLSAVVGDLSLLAGNVRLKRLELPGSSYSNLAALASLQELESLDLSYAAAPVDVSVVAKLPKLRYLNVSGSAVVNGAAIPASVRVSKDKKTTGL